jgi:hypothetical protein
MAIPFYVAPDQMVQDKAEYARKGIAKGKSIVAMESAVGITLVAENWRLAPQISKLRSYRFHGVGKYGEFEIPQGRYPLCRPRVMPTTGKMSFQSRWRMLSGDQQHLTRETAVGGGITGGSG